MCEPGDFRQENVTQDPFNVEYWNKRWVDNRIGFHKKEVNPLLLDYIGVATGQKHTISPVTDSNLFQENSKKIWFVPLCGKTLDIPYLLSQGFRVFGIEAVKQAIDELKSENSLDIVYDEKTKMYSGVNGRLQIYVGDLFTFPIEQFGPFDYVWDRGSFGAIEYPFRKEYIEVIKRALTKPDGSWKTFQYILATVCYDKSKYGGPPRSVSDEDILEFFGTWAKHRLLLSKQDDKKSHWNTILNGEVLQRIFQITPK